MVKGYKDQLSVVYAERINVAFAEFEFNLDWLVLIKASLRGPCRGLLGGTYCTIVGGV